MFVSMYVCVNICLCPHMLCQCMFVLKYVCFNICLSRHMFMSMYVCVEICLQRHSKLLLERHYMKTEHVVVAYRRLSNSRETESIVCCLEKVFRKKLWLLNRCHLNAESEVLVYIVLDSTKLL